jgi:prepilin-type N-terminal cleavage/methylation domain-containing protein
MARRLNDNGVTLIEMVVTMAVFSIVLAIAAFSFKDVLWRNQVSVAANDFVTALSFARSEAVTRGRTVVVCRSLDPTVANPFCSAAGGKGWETGYIAFVDTSGNGTREAGEDLLRVFSGVRGDVTMTGNVNVANRIRYAATGFSPGGEGTVTISNASKALYVILSDNGRVRTGTEAP